MGHIDGAAFERLASKGNYYKIIKMLKRALREAHYTQKLPIYLNLAQAYALSGSYKKAINIYDLVLKENNLGAQESPVRYMRSLCQLHTGDIDGFVDYSHRWSVPEAVAHKKNLESYGIPYVNKWDQLSELKGDKILISGEQGLGDQILYSRILTDLQRKGFKISMICSSSLLSFFAHNYPRIKFYPLGNSLSREEIQQHGGITAIGDLFTAYVNKYKEIPSVPYYTGDKNIAILSDKLRIGWVYKTSGMHEETSKRSLNPEIFKNLVAEVSLYSFQIPSEQLPFCTPLGDKINSFMDTANLALAMDACVTCDTAFAHLCLSMGIPTILVYDKYLDWRWKISLYPDVKLVTIHEPLDKKIIEALRELGVSSSF